MATDICPDNSTECLLRALLNDNTSRQILESLLQANNEYSWDPITFGFTVAIGVLAFVVAIVTVFQGCLAAGPGRLKAGKQAIGPWHVYSRPRFNLSQLALRTTAETPYIDSKAFESCLDQSGASQKDGISGNEALRNAKRKTASELSPPQYGSWTRYIPFAISDSDSSRYKAPYNATWLNLLQHVDLAKTTDFRQRRIWHTDFLGDTFQAAPAFGSMKALVFLTAYANDTCLIEQSHDLRQGFFSVRGLTSDFMPQYLDTLGPAATYISYALAESFQRSLGPGIDLSPNRADMIAAFQMFNGTMSFPGRTINISRYNQSDSHSEIRRRMRKHPSGPESRTKVLQKYGCSMVLALCLGNVLYRPRAFPKRTKRLKDAIKALAEDSMWDEDFPRRFRNTFARFADSTAGYLDRSKKKAVWLPQEFHRFRRRPFMDMKTLWTDKASEDDPEQMQRHLAMKMGDVRIWTKSQQDSSRPARWAQGPRNWIAPVEIASVVYVLTRRLSRRDDAENERDDKDIRSIIETLDGDRSRTNVYSVLLQNEILCIDNWLSLKEQQDSTILTRALLALLKAVDIRRSLGKAKDDDTLQVPQKRGGMSIREPLQLETSADGPRTSDKICTDSCFLSALQFRWALSSAFVSPNHVGKYDLASDSDSGESAIEDDCKSVRRKLAMANGDISLQQAGLENAHAQKQFWDLVEVLRYRALLYGAMLDLCVDSSVFVESYTDFTVKVL